MVGMEFWSMADGNCIDSLRFWLCCRWLQESKLFGSVGIALVDYLAWDICRFSCDTKAKEETIGFASIW